MQQYQEEFNTLLSVKPEPNEHELALFGRARKHIQRLAWIPGIEMIAVSNSLSMYATHEDSDIDLFIVTAPRMIWFVRFFITLQLWMMGVWRHGDDIAGNFCLSFFVTTEAMNLEKITIKDDIYLYYWIYHLKPILVRGAIYERFLEENGWVKVPEEQRIQNQEFRIQDSKGRKEVNSWVLGNSPLIKGDVTKGQGDLVSGKIPPTPFIKGEGNKVSIYQRINKLIRSFLLPHTLKSYNKLGRPEGIIISDEMLKFHPEDRREGIRDAIVKKNFDK